MAISEWTDQNLAEVIIIGGMVFCALSVRFTMFSFISSESLLFALEGRVRPIFYDFRRQELKDRESRNLFVLLLFRS